MKNMIPVLFGKLRKKADLVGGKVPADQLPSYVDDVLEYANLAAFPETGESGKIYVALDTNYTYRWSGTAYVQIGGGGASTAEDVTYDSTLATHTTGSVGAELASQSEQIVTLDAKLTSKSASSSDVGKFAKISSVVDGKITEWEFGEAGGGGGGDVDYLTVVNGELCIKYTEV